MGTTRWGRQNEGIEVGKEWVESGRGVSVTAILLISFPLASLDPLSPRSIWTYASYITRADLSGPTGALKTYRQVWFSYPEKTSGLLPLIGC